MSQRFVTSVTSLPHPPHAPTNQPIYYTYHHTQQHVHNTHITISTAAPRHPCDGHTAVAVRPAASATPNASAYKVHACMRTCRAGALVSALPKACWCLSAPCLFSAFQPAYHPCGPSPAPCHVHPHDIRAMRRPALSLSRSCATLPLLSTVLHTMKVA